MKFAPAPASSPTRVVVLDHLPPVVSREQYMALMHVGERTLYGQLAAGTCEVAPALVRPYRWLRADLEAYLSTVTLTSTRKRRARRMRLVRP